MRVTQTEWEIKASCLKYPELFEKVAYGATEKVSSPDDRARIVTAKKICITCPVRAECLSDAMAEESYLGAIERHGIRGGLTAQERITKATEDSLCARCQTNTVVQPNNPAKVKRLCQSCQIKLQNDPTARYFP